MSEDNNTEEPSILDEITEELTKEDKDFVLNYLRLGRNAVKAYMLVYPNAKYDSARVQSCRKLAKTNIKNAISEYYAGLWKKKEERIAEIFNKLVEISDADIGDFIDENGNIKVKEFDRLNTYLIDQYNKTVTDTKEGQNKKISIKLMDRLKAIQELVKILGMIKEKVDIKISFDKDNVKEIQDIFNEQVTSTEDNK